MQIIQVQVSDTDMKRYHLERNEMAFEELVNKISIEYARQSLLQAHIIAEETGLSGMSLNEINEEIKAARNAKGNS